MSYFLHLRNDIKQIVREPVMLILMLAPLIVITLFKLLIWFVMPYLETETGFDILPWSPYILSFVLIMIPGLLGIVTGFMLLDDRDGNITELYSVTPMGLKMYLFNRLSLSAMLSFIYSFIAYYVLAVYKLPLFSLLYLALLLSTESVIIGFLLFSWADDKVKGLTLAKGLNILNMFAFADILSLKWLTAAAFFFPSYWISFMIVNPASLSAYLFSFIIHSLWLAVIPALSKSKTSLFHLLK